jgi:hypothetical protein
MPWTYGQITGLLTDPDGTEAARGYSGHGEGVNNPAMQGVPDMGPIPRGKWRINQACTHPRLGPVAMPLTMIEGDDLGRFAFYIHGDNPQMNHTASHGCIILPRAVREAVQASKDRTLLVTE